MNMQSVFKTAMPYIMIDIILLYDSFGSQLQLSIVLDYNTFQMIQALTNYLIPTAHSTVYCLSYHSMS